MPRTDAENIARRAWASQLARQEAADPLTAALNSPYIRGYEKRAVQALVDAEPWRTPDELARVKALILSRANNPSSLENWGRRQAFSRAYARTAPDVSAPSHFNTRRDYTTR